MHYDQKSVFSYKNTLQSIDKLPFYRKTKIKFSKSGDFNITKNVATFYVSTFILQLHNFNDLFRINYLIIRVLMFWV